MGLRINTNVLSINAQRNLNTTSKALGKALERLSSGSRINRAGDDAAGLAISEGLQSQIRGLKVAVRNSNDAIGFLNTAEGALSEITNITQRLRELAIQAANGTLSVTDRNYLESEKNALIEEFQRIASQTQFNGVSLLDGSFQTTALQVGVNKGEIINFKIGDARSSSIGALASISGAQGLLMDYSSYSLSINGVAIDQPTATNDNLSTLGNYFSSIAIASQINEKSSQTNVKAEVQDTVVVFQDTVWSSFSGTIDAGFKINDVTISGTGVNTAQKFVDAVNDFSNSTGVKARIKDGTTDDIELVAEDGRNVEINFSNYNGTITAGNTLSQGGMSTLAGALFGDSDSFTTAGIGDAATLYSGTGGVSASITISTAFLGSVSSGITILKSGAIRLLSADDINITGPTSTAILGFTQGNYSVDRDQSINKIDLTTTDGAADALSVVDAALQQITALRADLGAVQNRLESTSNNISITLENISSARAQIRDADIAVETAELTRSQILQQAGVAVLGQANATSQIALSLLRF
jgi:flagellin